MSKRLILVTLAVTVLLAFCAVVAFAQTPPVPVGPVETPTPLPKVQLPPVPGIIWDMWLAVFGRSMLYGQQPEPVETPTAVSMAAPTTVPISTPMPTATLDPYVQELMESFKKAVPADFPMQVKEALEGFKIKAGVTEWTIKYLANAPFDWLVQSLLAFSVGFLAYCSTWITLSNVAYPLVERRLFGRFQSARVAFSTYLFCISAAFFAALLVLIWWDASAAWP